MRAERQPNADERRGMSWWNSLPEMGRREWLRRAGSAVVADAWAEFKRHARETMIAPDDRHAPHILAGDRLIVDTTRKTPEPGQFFVLEYRCFTGSAAPHSVASIHQNRPAARPDGTRDYIADALAGFIKGCVVDIQRG
jgi:hypothetical protein